MRRWLPWIYAAIVLVGLLLLSATARAQGVPDRSDVVAQFAAGAGLGQGATAAERTEKAAAFTRKVAATLHATDQRWGLLEKAGGNNVQGYSVDCLAYRDEARGVAHLVDIVQASDGPDARAGWLAYGAAEDVPIARWRVPPDVPPTPQEPPQEPGEPGEVVTSLRELRAALAALQARVDAIAAGVAELQARPLPSTTIPVLDIAIGVPYLGTARGTATPRR